MKATWNAVMLAQSDDTVAVEGSHYFPLGSIAEEHFGPSGTHTVCPWKGTAGCYSIEAGGKTNPDAAWFCPEPKPGAEQVAGRVAFWKGVRVTEMEAKRILRAALDLWSIGR